MLLPPCSLIMSVRCEGICICRIKVLNLEILCVPWYPAFALVDIPPLWFLKRHYNPIAFVLPDPVLRSPINHINFWCCCGGSNLVSPLASIAVVKVYSISIRLLQISCLNQCLWMLTWRIFVVNFGVLAVKVQMVCMLSHWMWVLWPGIKSM